MGNFNCRIILKCRNVKKIFKIIPKNYDIMFYIIKSNTKTSIIQNVYSKYTYKH